ncbi:endonuclease/exonuclease/phosphatase family protein [Pseudoxanthomonas daejeonensis]|uniref:endonuclease/exonuclease/phosphatase family protein n=1 Tax=Pseudoxanthomonas daejeonensis TaxID=266062 RepID=UPI001F546C42|nr:endonuclease/exonuclease/phosphatase family protein [Pseudoxanthomonas daejeonensis]UNK57457.1 endonuclease/exonuclease/phosphatase family protein [Pseudoxanthomonas daejeonensis]
MDRLHRVAASLLVYSGLLLCAAPLPALAGALEHGTTAPADAAPGFSVVTLNLHHDRDDWPRRRVQIVETLRRLQPDAIALQEVLQHESLPNQATWLARELGYQSHFVTTDPPSHKRRYGIALLTRTEMLEDGETMLHPLEDHRTAGFARVMVGDQPLNLYFTHLYWAPDGAATRTQQLADLLAYVDATAGDAPSLIAGDFNADATAPELDALHAGWEDAWGTLHPDADVAASSTLNPAYFSVPARVDHVFAQRGRLRPVEAELLFAEPDADGTWASDHRGLLVRFSLATDAEPAAEPETP